MTRSVLERIEQQDEKIGAYLTVCSELAMEQAKEADKIIARKEASPLTGIPLGIKDLVCTRGIRTTCASRILENFAPPFDAFIMKKLNGQNAVMVGKTNMDEFAMGSSTEHSAFKPTRNPWDRERIPGGSSGGSAAAVAADMCIGAIGSDTGGSIRQPASHCSVTGLKPTYGRVSRFGLVAFASSLDQLGPVTKNVTDSAILLNAIAGHDPDDSTSAPRDVPDYTRALEKGLQGIENRHPQGILRDRRRGPMRFGGRRKRHSGSGRLRRATRGDIPSQDKGRGGLLLRHRALRGQFQSGALRRRQVRLSRARKSGHDRDVPENQVAGFGPEVKRRIIIGTYCLSAGYYDAYYGKASQVRSLITQDYKKAFESCDAIAAPVAPSPAFKIGENIDDPLTMYLSDIFTLSVNLAGIPAYPCRRASPRKGFPSVSKSWATTSARRKF